MAVSAVNTRGIEPIGLVPARLEAGADPESRRLGQSLAVRDVRVGKPVIRNLVIPGHG